jgi:putative sterol carrier protein
VAEAMQDANVLMELFGIARSIKKPYQLSVENPNRDWTIDFEKATIKPGKADKPELTITMKEADLQALVSGKTTPVAMFMQGKIKAKGNMSILMKLQGLQPKLDKLRSKY